MTAPRDDAGPSRPQPGDVLAADLPLLEQITVVREAALLSASSHARVHRVVDEAGSVFVVKLVHPATAARAVRLAAAVATTSAANPVLVHGTVEGFGYLVHPWRPRHLADERTPMPVGLVADRLEGVAEALELLNRGGYVHGDVKPGNILLDESGVGILADLDEATPTGTVRKRWTPGWGAPEVAAGRPCATGTDRWGLALLIASLAGGAAAQAAALAADRDGLVGCLPPALAGALATDLQPEPEARDVPATTLVRLLRAAALEDGEETPRAAGSAGAVRRGLGPAAHEAGRYTGPREDDEGEPTVRRVRRRASEALTDGPTTPPHGPRPDAAGAPTNPAGAGPAGEPAEEPPPWPLLDPHAVTIDRPSAWTRRPLRLDIDSVGVDDSRVADRRVMLVACVAGAVMALVGILATVL